MCGRYELVISWQALAARFGVSDVSKEAPVISRDGEKWQPRYNIAPSQRNPVVIAGEQGSGGGERQLLLMKWGLVPSWAKEPKTPFSTINARAETVTSKSTYRKPFMSQRCLVPATGYFEWAATTEAGGREGKQPYKVQAHADTEARVGEVGEEGEEEIFALAGLYDVWRGTKGEELYTYTIVTTPASPGLEGLHPRSPAILTRDAEEVWLDTAVNTVMDAERLMGLLVPYPSEKMSVYPVGMAVNSPRNDWPAVIQAA